MTTGTCPEVMNGPAPLPDKRIIISPRSLGTPDVLRGPDASGLKASPKDGAAVIVVLSDSESDTPARLQAVNIAGNVKYIAMETTTTPYGDWEPYNNGEDINVASGTVSLVTEQSPQGILVYKFRIILVEANDIESPYALRLQVYACVKGRLHRNTQ